MYVTFYNLSGHAFKLTPDSRFFFGSRPHKKAMAYLTYGLSQGEGFIVITGDIGAGKSTLIDHLFSQLDSAKYIAAKVVTSHLGAEDFLRMVAAEFGLPYEGLEKAVLLKNLELFFAQAFRDGKRILLVVDEVQNFPAHSLEELRMLSNFQIGEHPLLQIYLVGQPQFRQTFSHPDMEQLRQRVIASHHLEAMDFDQTRGYIEHRLGLVGWRDDPSITDLAFQKIFEATGGVPRRINLLCERLLLFAFLEEKHEIDHNIVAEVAHDIMSDEVAKSPVKTNTSKAASRKAAPGKRVGRSANYATAKSLARLSKRVAEVEKRLNGHRHVPAGLDSLVPAVDRLTRATSEVQGMRKSVEQVDGEAATRH